MKQIATGLWQISLMPRNSINCYVAEGFLIDAGIKSSANKIINSVGGMGVHTHVLTHTHADHQGSTQKICSRLRIPLWVSEKEKALAESGDATGGYRSQNNFITRFQNRYWAGPGHPVAKTLKEQDQVGDFIVVETPGHSIGHLSFFREKDGVLILGDVATNMNLLTTIEGLHLPPGLFTLNREENIRSLRKLATLHPSIVCFGHGPVLVNNKRQFEQFAARR